VGEDGYFKVFAQRTQCMDVPASAGRGKRRMTDLANRFTSPDPLTHRALNQAARELLLAGIHRLAVSDISGTTVELCCAALLDLIFDVSTIWPMVLNPGSIEP